MINRTFVSYLFSPNTILLRFFESNNEEGILKFTKILIHVVILSLVFSFLTGCGGGGSADTETLSTSSRSLTGQFIDGPVAGLTYECSSGLQGVTDTQGKFTCFEGDKVTFKVGHLAIGSAEANNTITPYTLYPDNQEAAINVAQMLQSLDDDGNLTKLVIDNAKVKVIEAADADIDITADADTFESKMYIVLPSQTVDRSSAIEHMNRSISNHILKTENAGQITEDPVATQQPMAQPEPATMPDVTDQEASAATDEATQNPVTTELPVAQPEPATMPDVTDQEASAATDEATQESNVPEQPITSQPETGSIPVKQAPVCQMGPAMQEGKVTDSATGEPLAGVEVSIGGCVTTTDNQGHYLLNNIAENERAVVTFTANGYFKNSIAIQIKQYSTGKTTLSPNYLEYALDSYDHEESYSSQTDKTLTATTNANVEIPAGVYTTSNGEMYKGNVYADIAYEDILTEKGKEVFPGAFEGKDVNGQTVPFVSYGLMVVELKDANGNTLQLTDNAVVTFPATLKATAESISLWYYDYQHGMWIEDGFAIRQENGTYRGEVSHAGTWSLNKPIVEAPGIYKGRIIYSNGNPVRDARVYAIGTNWVRSTLSTDENGNFEIKVIPGEDFTLFAFNYKWKYGARYNGMIGGIASGETVINRK